MLTTEIMTLFALVSLRVQQDNTIENPCCNQWGFLFEW